VAGRRRRVPRRGQILGAATAVAVVVLALVAGTLLIRDRSPQARETAAPAAEPTPSGVDEIPAAAAPATSPSSGSAAASSSSHSTRAEVSASGAPRPASNTASRLRTLPSGTRQVVMVTADGFGSSTATLEAFTKVNGVWQPAFGAMTARVGTRGFADRKIEGDLKTPTGVYSIGGTMYGIAGSPGVRYRYHQLQPDDWWNENPATAGYNSFEHGPNPGGASEALWQISPQYTYFAVINYNIPVAVSDPPRGSGIFLHVAVPGRATAGCVALSEPDLLRILRWLDPGASPRMVLAPGTTLSRY
jgi:L,D-peptidoglycan transpeptidase YkuD (ErfK/YbiS/YcfS/YnhG family)